MRNTTYAAGDSKLPVTEALEERMKVENISTKVGHTSEGNTNTSAGMGETKAKKPYNAPQVIEHGSVEEITGFLAIGLSGIQPT